jgi:malonyl CoA-acyl carrier protein transacylase
MSRAAVAFPGRGSYGPRSLGSLPPSHPWVRRADELRAAAQLPPLTALDGAGGFDPRVHLRPSNAWPLIFLTSLLDAERIADDHEVVVVIASSTGWYTALAASGALGFDDAFRLVQEMGRAAEAPLADGVAAGELIYPLTDDAWRPDDDRRAEVRAALSQANGSAGLAIDLGAFAVIGGTIEALDRIGSSLPPVAVAERTYPLRLAGGDGWHTPLRREAADRAADSIGDLTWDRPNVTLVDDRGARFTPWSTDPADLAAQSLRGQAGSTYDFAAGLRVALREYAPDVVLLPGPGASLGAACAQVIVAEGYRGIRSRTEFEEAQSGVAPILLSMRR